MATRLAIREKQLETWTAIIQECIVNVNEKVYHFGLNIRECPW